MPVMVRMKHLRAVGMCNREPRRFCAAQGWSWQEFLDTGIPAERFYATGDPMAKKVADAAVKEAGAHLIYRDGGVYSALDGAYLGPQHGE
jgi:hypothetical protein